MWIAADCGFSGDEMLGFLARPQAPNPATRREMSMAFTVQSDKFRFEPKLRAGVAGKRVLITGAGKDRGLGQAFALAAGLNGAAVVGIPFHSSYVDAFDLVEAL